MSASLLDEHRRVNKRIIWRLLWHFLVAAGEFPCETWLGLMIGGEAITGEIVGALVQIW